MSAETAWRLAHWLAWLWLLAFLTVVLRLRGYL